MGEDIGRSIFPIALLIAGILAGCFFAGPTRVASIGAGGQTQHTANEYPYYVEFRVAVDGVYGHSYIAYGRLDRLGQPASATYADIHPTGDFLGMVLGHFFSMKAATIPEKDTLGYKIASRFRRSLTAADYRRLKSVIVRIRAVGMGMQTPTTLSLPYDFIPRLQVINERTLRPTSTLASAPVNFFWH
jgi:hypothetical protein